MNGGGDMFKRANGDYGDYLRDESRLTGAADSIAFPRTETELCGAIRAAADAGSTITAQGARTGITGGAVPAGGRIINLSRMKTMGAARDNGDGSARIKVQPGVLLDELTAGSRWFFPPDPTETTASLGGMAACNASGAKSFLYGSTRAYVTGLRAALADGSILCLKRGREKARGRSFILETESGRRISGDLPAYSQPEIKNAAGYFARDDMDLIDLFIGSEGTLGILSEIELRLVRRPGVVWGLVAFLPTEGQAADFVLRLRGLRFMPAAMEFFDSHALTLLRRQKESNPAFADIQTPPETGAAVYVEYHSDIERTVEEAVSSMSAVLAEYGGDEDSTWLASDSGELGRIRRFRHAAPEAVNLVIDMKRKADPAITKLGTDLAVPDNALKTMMKLYTDDLAKNRLDHAIFGHIGDNHLHVNILPDTLDQYERGMTLHRSWAREAVALGGTVSAEHGIGKLKTAMLRIMYGEDGIRQMRELKRLFDPAGIFNPGNLFPAE